MTDSTFPSELFTESENGDLRREYSSPMTYESAWNALSQACRLDISDGILIHLFRKLLRKLRLRNSSATKLLIRSHSKDAADTA